MNSISFVSTAKKKILEIGSRPQNKTLSPNMGKIHINETDIESVLCLCLSVQYNILYSITQAYV